MATCREPSCTAGLIHEDGATYPCVLCARRAAIESLTIQVMSGLDAFLDDLVNRRAVKFPNRATRRAAKSRRHDRAAWLWERHDERRMAWALS